MLDFSKNPDGLIPAIIQDIATRQILMTGYMNEEAYQTTLKEQKVTFFSRSKQRLWTKGESSGNFLHVKKILADCDNDALLIYAEPAGPTCHTGNYTCFNEIPQGKEGFIGYLKQVIRERKNSTNESSYTRKLFERGINKIAQKVGEEAVELVIEAKDNNDELFKNEAADLLFHYLVLLEAKGMDLDQVIEVLQSRHK